MNQPTPWSSYQLVRVIPTPNNAKYNEHLISDKQRAEYVKEHVASIHEGEAAEYWLVEIGSNQVVKLAVTVTAQERVEVEVTS